MPVVFITIINLEHYYGVIKSLLYHFLHYEFFSVKCCCYFCLLSVELIQNGLFLILCSNRKICNRKIFLGKYFVKNGDKISSSSPINRDFLFVCLFVVVVVVVFFLFFCVNWFNGSTFLLNTSNISNFILGHNDLLLLLFNFCFCIVLHSIFSF